MRKVKAERDSAEPLRKPGLEQCAKRSPPYRRYHYEHGASLGEAPENVLSDIGGVKRPREPAGDQQRTRQAAEQR